MSLPSALLLALTVAVAVAGCSPSAPAGPGRDTLRATLLTPGDFPRPGWSLVGTTDRRPQEEQATDPLADAPQAKGACRAALAALAEPAPEAVAFTRAVYRAPGSSGPGDVTLTVQSFGAAPTRGARITAVTRDCTRPLTITAGDATVDVRLRPRDYHLPGSAGFSSLYDAEGLRHSYDEVVVTRGSTLITASVTGPDGEANRALLATVAAKAAARYDAAAAG